MSLRSRPMGGAARGYTVVDPETGAGGYLIEGGARGGDSAGVRRIHRPNSHRVVDYRRRKCACRPTRAWRYINPECDDTYSACTIRGACRADVRRCDRLSDVLFLGRPAAWDRGWWICAWRTRRQGRYRCSAFLRWCCAWSCHTVHW